MSGTRLILNPVAGGGSDTEAIEAWASRRPEVEIRRTTGAGDAERWAREAAEEGCGLVVAAGGDGTVHEVACGLLDAGRTRAALGVLPLGTGNDLVRSLRVPDDVDDALELLDRGHREGLDVVRVTSDRIVEPYFFNALTGGFSGEIHEALNEEVKRSWGPLSYLRSGLETWGERTSWTVELEVDGETSEHEALNVVVANGRFAGHGLPVAPGADPFDGVLEVVVVLDAPALELSGLAARMLAGEPAEHDALVRTRGRTVGIRCSEPFPVSVDGEPGEASEIGLEVVPGRLPVVTGRLPTV